MNKQTEKLRITIAYLSIGCYRYLHGVRKKNPNLYDSLADTYGGHIGILDTITQYCYNIERKWQCKKNKNIDYVWDYSISEEFGYFATANLADGIEIDADAMIDSLIDEVESIQ